MDFYAINTQRDLHQDAAIIQFACNPALHLPDDDTFMENIAAIVDQVRTVRSFAPGAKIRIDPVTFDSKHPRLETDPRNATLVRSSVVRRCPEISFLWRGWRKPRSRWMANQLAPFRRRSALSPAAASW